MKWRLVPYEIPNGGLVAGVAARLRRRSDGLTITATTSDTNGVIEFQLDGNPGPVYVDIFRNGFQYIGSSEPESVVGTLSLSELPDLLWSAFGDVVLRGTFNDLKVTAEWVTSAWGARIETGAVLIHGLPLVNYTYDYIPAAVATAGRKDRVVARLYRTGSSIGKTELAVLTGTDSASPVAPVITQSTDIWEVPLATLTYPAGIGTPVVTDEREFIYDRYRSRPAPTNASVQSASAGTANVSGEQVLATTLTIPNGVEALVIADAVGTTSPSTVTFPWEYTYGVGILTSPDAVVLSPDGAWLYVAGVAGDTNIGARPYNGSAVTAGGTNNAGAVTGLCADASGNVYMIHSQSGIGYLTRLTPGSTAYAQQVSLGASGNSCYGITTDNTYLYITNWGTGEIVKRLCSGTMGLVAAQSGWGTVLGIQYLGGSLYVTRMDGLVIKANTALGSLGTLVNYTSAEPLYGISTDGTNLYVSSSSGNKVRKITTAGVFIAEFGTPGSANGQFNIPRGVHVDVYGDIWVADTGNNRVQRFSSGFTYTGEGSLAVEIDGLVSGYIGIESGGAGEVTNRATAVVTGTGLPKTVAVRAKANSGTFLLSNLRLDARVVTRR